MIRQTPGVSAPSAALYGEIIINPSYLTTFRDRSGTGTAIGTVRPKLISRTQTQNISTVSYSTTIQNEFHLFVMKRHFL